eukprot:CAMPEP_0170472872 /NCGR_PEP_ID=MMETSP0123-20130129/14855_1 /TAXON_ID=182087 /ORGANISM="Favella ehrenbergii, Strain Fehren 1" /LENGTH=85 /DNA_ID=CAMNT_0010741481 /DNA_START=15 /DNA_END=272 /DNA_ORIENTATION=+
MLSRALLATLCLTLAPTLCHGSPSSVKTAFMGQHANGRKHKSRHPERKQISEEWCGEGMLLHPKMAASCVPKDEVMAYLKVDDIA